MSSYQRSAWLKAAVLATKAISTYKYKYDFKGLYEVYSNLKIWNSFLGFLGEIAFL